MAPQDQPRSWRHPIAIEDHPRDLASVSREATSLAVNRETPALARLREFTRLERLFAREVPPGVIEPALAAMPRLSELHIYGTRMESFAPLAELPLRHLHLTWAHKAASIAPLARLDRLETLVIGDLKRVCDFSPLGRLSSLVALHIEAGMWSTQKVDSLAFLRHLPQLRAFGMHQLTLGDGDLTPICALANLEWLSLPTRYAVRDYARLSVCLPHTRCEQFASHTTYKVGTLSQTPGVEFEYEEHGILIGKPSTGFRCADPKAAKLIARREALLDRWREHYRSVPDPATDRRETLD